MMGPLTLVCLAIFTGILLWNLSERHPVTAMIITLAAWGFAYFTYPSAFDDTVALWTSITTWTAAAWTHATVFGKAFFGGMTTAWSWTGFSLVVGAGTIASQVIVWPLAKKLAKRKGKIEIDRAEARVAEAKRQAEEEREGRVEAEKQVDAAVTVARQAVAEKAEAKRLYEGLIEQFQQAVSLADRRGKELKEMRAKRRAEKGEVPVQQIEKAAKPATKGQDKKSPGTQGKRRPPKRSRLPPRLPRR